MNEFFKRYGQSFAWGTIIVVPTVEDVEYEEVSSKPLVTDEVEEENAEYLIVE